MTIFFKLFQWDLEDKNESIFMSILRDVMSEDGTDVVVLLSREEFRSTKSQTGKQAANLPSCLANGIKSLQFCLKHLQEKGSHSIDGNFNYSSIDQSDFMNFSCDPATISQMSSGAQIDPRPSE